MVARIFADSTDPADIPPWADGIGGYVDGAEAWSAAEWAMFGDKPQIRYNVTGDPTRGNAADIESGGMNAAQTLVWWDTRHEEGVPDLAVYVNRDNIDAVMAAMEGHNPAIILSTLDGTCPTAYHGHILTAVQFAGPDLTGGHYDLTLVYDDAWHPSKPSGPDPVLIASARKIAAQVSAEAARMVAITNAL
jgi:hypothetical protein